MRSFYEPHTSGYPESDSGFNEYGRSTGEQTPGRRVLTSRLTPAVRQFRGGTSFSPSPRAVHGAGSGGAPLPGEVRGRMERAFEADFSSVRIHESGEAAAHGAEAMTQGSDIHFAPGRWDPSSPAGLELLGHELTHVVQQAQGRVSATTQAKGVAANVDRGLEREADELGARAARGERVASSGVTAPAAAGPAQFRLTEEERRLAEALARGIHGILDGAGPGPVESGSPGHPSHYAGGPLADAPEDRSLLWDLYKALHFDPSFGQSARAWAETAIRRMDARAAHLEEVEPGLPELVRTRIDALVPPGAPAAADAPMCSPEDAEAMEAICEEIPEVAESAGLPAYDRALMRATRERYRIPTGGWRQTSAFRGEFRLDLSRELGELVERIRTDPSAAAHVRETLDMFYDDPDPRSRIAPGDIDIALVLAIANRESGPRYNELVLSGDTEHRIVTGGPDTYRGGRGGLDYVGGRRSLFPSSIRDEVTSVRDTPRLAAHLTPGREGANPAEVREHDLLAAYIVEVRARTQLFERQVRERTAEYLTPAQQTELLAHRTVDARRAWIQAAFGSDLGGLLSNALGRFRRAMTGSEAEDPFHDVLPNDQVNLNSIITVDAIIEHSGHSGRRTRLTAAEASMLDVTLPPELLGYTGSAATPLADGSEPMCEAPAEGAAMCEAPGTP